MDRLKPTENAEFLGGKSREGWERADNQWKEHARGLSQAGCLSLPVSQGCISQSPEVFPFVLCAVEMRGEGVGTQASVLTWHEDIDTLPLTELRP